MKIRNTFIIFIVSGFWHGANWTFIVWGLLHAVYYLPLLLSNTNRSNIEIVAYGKFFPSFRELMAMLITFGLTTFAWIFFRAESIGHAIDYIAGIFSTSLFETPTIPAKALTAGALVIGFLLMEWIGRDQQYAIQKFGVTWPGALRWGFYYFLIFLLGLFMQTNEMPFIYFQF